MRLPCQSARPRGSSGRGRAESHPPCGGREGPPRDRSSPRRSSRRGRRRSWWRRAGVLWRGRSWTTRRSTQRPPGRASPCCTRTIRSFRALRAYWVGFGPQAPSGGVGLDGAHQRTHAEGGTRRAVLGGGTPYLESAGERASPPTAVPAAPGRGAHHVRRLTWLFALEAGPAGTCSRAHRRRNWFAPYCTPRAGARPCSWPACSAADPHFAGRCTGTGGRPGPDR